MYLTFNPETDQNGATVRLVSHDGVPSLKDMQEVVGGWIEAADLFEDFHGRVSVYVNEEGLLVTDPVFTISTKGWQYHPDRSVLAGPFLIVRCDQEGETVGLTEGDVDRIVYGKQHVISFELGQMIPILEVV